MKKVGIISLPLHTNYGGILQAIALQKVVESFGYDVEYIDKSFFVSLPSIKRRPLIYLRRLIGNLRRGKIGEIKWEKSHNQQMAIKMHNLIPTINTHLKRRIVNDLSQIKESDYDAIIVGSDQVWRKQYFESLWNKPIDFAFLSFTKHWNIKRLAYSSSFGTEIWDYDDSQTKECQSAIKNFDGISVREQSAIDMCKLYLNYNKHVTLVADPTLLLSKKDYIEIFDLNNINPSNGNLLVYILDITEEIRQFIDNLANAHNLHSFYVNTDAENENLNPKKRIQPSLESWLRGFIDADYVITDSFHACVFSLIFNKKCFVFKNNKRGNNRIMNLYNLFGLKPNYINVNSVNFINVSYNWDIINSKILSLKNQSLSYLKSMLHR